MYHLWVSSKAEGVGIMFISIIVCSLVESCWSSEHYQLIVLPWYS